jgi:hypothetical protein
LRRKVLQLDSAQAHSAAEDHEQAHHVEVYVVGPLEERGHVRTVQQKQQQQGKESVEREILQGNHKERFR